MDINEIFGNKIETLDDGSIRVTTPEGKVLMIDKDGGMRVNLQSINRVCLENIFDLQSYIIMREKDLTVHKIEFRDGGSAKIVYTSQGKLVEFSGNKIGQTLTKGSDITIRSFTAAQAQQKKP